ESSPRSETSLKFFEDQFTTVINWCDDKASSRVFRQQLPGNNVGVMLQGRYQNLVTGFNPRPDERIHDKVDRLRCTSNKDNFALISGVDVLLHSRARAFVSLRCAIAQHVYCPVNIRRVTLIKPFYSIDDGFRLLCRRGIIQVDERFSVHLLMKSGKVSPDFQQIEFG